MAGAEAGLVRRNGSQPPAARCPAMPYVSSSAVEWVHRDPGTGTVEIRYKKGDGYSYFDVPGAVYRSLLEAPSIGAYVNERIKPFYRYEIEERRKRFRPD